MINGRNQLLNVSKVCLKATKCILYSSFFLMICFCCQYLYLSLGSQTSCAVFNLSVENILVFEYKEDWNVDNVLFKCKNKGSSVRFIMTLYSIDNNQITTILHVQCYREPSINHKFLFLTLNYKKCHFKTRIHFFL